MGPFHDDKEKQLLLKASDSAFNVISKRRDNYSRQRYKRQVKQRDATANLIAEGAIQRIVNEIAFK